MRDMTRAQAVVSTHSRPKAAGILDVLLKMEQAVSTHSRPKAAGALWQTGAINPQFQHTAARRRLGGGVKSKISRRGFNTQPPEGGWLLPRYTRISFPPFQHTAARRRLAPACADGAPPARFNTQPPEGGWGTAQQYGDPAGAEFQHTAARRRLALQNGKLEKMNEFQHTAARRRLDGVAGVNHGKKWFQHTAARRRLVSDNNRVAEIYPVSTHSRPKAAGDEEACDVFDLWFQHTAARRRLDSV